VFHLSRNGDETWDVKGLMPGLGMGQVAYACPPPHPTATSDDVPAVSDDTLDVVHRLARRFGRVVGRQKPVRIMGALRMYELGHQARDNIARFLLWYTAVAALLLAERPRDKRTPFTNRIEKFLTQENLCLLRSVGGTDALVSARNDVAHEAWLKEHRRRPRSLAVLIFVIHRAARNILCAVLDEKNRRGPSPSAFVSRTAFSKAAARLGFQLEPVNRCHPHR
jgi:hypothetical protein